MIKLVCAIPTKDRSELLLRTLRFYKKHVRIPTKFIIFQDGSKDPLSTSVLEEVLVNSRHTISLNKISSKNVGRGAGLHFLRKKFLKMEGDFLICMDDDVRVRGRAIESLIDILIQKPDFGISAMYNSMKSKHGFVEYAKSAGGCYICVRKLVLEIDFEPFCFLMADLDFFAKAWRSGYTPVFTKCNILHRRLPDSITFHSKRSDVIDFLNNQPYNIRALKMPDGHFMFVKGVLKKFKGQPPKNLKRDQEHVCGGRRSLFGSLFEDSDWFKEIN